MSAETNSELFTRQETAKRLGISVPTLDRLTAARAISFYKVGWRVYFDESQIREYLETVRCPARERIEA